MQTKDKKELRGIVKEIPEIMLKQNVKTLWRKYAPDYNYGTFRKYLSCYRKIEELNKTEKKDGS